MKLDPTFAAAGIIPVLIGLEYALGRRQGKALYGLAGSLSDIATSAGQNAIMLALGVSLLGLYGALEARFGVLDVPMDSPLVWVAVYLLLELLVYVRHRSGHEIAMFWAIHVVHHQSPYMNFTVAQRVGWLQWVQTMLFVWPLALLGVPTAMFGVCFAIIHSWQFVTHTELVPRLGLLDRLIVTPSNHRVHHGRNARYLDRNYGFTLPVFDHLLGTYTEETEPVRYGTIDALPSYGPLDNNLRPWRELFAKMRRAPSWSTALQVPLRHPAWDPVTGARHVHAEGVAEREVPGDGPARPLVVAAVLLGSIGTYGLMQVADGIPAALRVTAALTALALTCLVAALDGPPRST